jgi:hypothetical protein
MFVFTLLRALFKFNAKTPESAPLFQLPPRIGTRVVTAAPPSAR